MMHRMKMSTVAAVAALGATVAPAFGGDLEITVGSIKVDFGTVMVALHAEADAGTFPDVKGAVAAQWAKAAPGARRFVFAGLPAGRFAIAVFHDGNGNGELDTDILGIPKEGYGFSRNTKGSFGPPRFADAAVEVPPGGGTVRTATDLIYRED